MNKRRRSEIKNAVISTFRMYGKPVELPVPIKAITKSFPNVRLIPYSTQMERRNLSYSEMVTFAGTEDAFTDYDAKSDLYVIYYNNVSHSHTASNRYRWSIAHELGHVVLEHHKKHIGSRIFRNSLGTVLYHDLEEEADMFAAYILVPHVVVTLLGADMDLTMLKNYCKISGAAAEYRLSGLWNWRTQSSLEPYDFEILNHFSSFVEQSPCPPKMQAWLNAHRSCPKCHTRISDRDTQYCTSCGYSRPLYFKKEKEIMEYPGIQTHDNLRAIECPVCKNTEATEDGNYCMICGESLVNMCGSTESAPFVKCDQILPGNARYCCQCGTASTFLKRGLLKTWDGKTYVDEELVQLPF